MHACSSLDQEKSLLECFKLNKFRYLCKALPSDYHVKITISPPSSYPRFVLCVLLHVIPAEHVLKNLLLQSEQNWTSNPSGKCLAKHEGIRIDLDIM